MGQQLKQGKAHFLGIQLPSLSFTAVGILLSLALESLQWQPVVPLLPILWSLLPNTLSFLMQLEFDFILTSFSFPYPALTIFCKFVL